MIESVVERFINMHLVIGEDGHSTLVDILVVPDEHQREHRKSRQLPVYTCVSHLLLDADFEEEYT